MRIMGSLAVAVRHTILVHQTFASRDDETRLFTRTQGTKRTLAATLKSSN
jgi:hypothetical protein